MATDTTWVVAETKLLDQAFWTIEKDLLFDVLFPLLADSAMAGATGALAGLLEVGIGVDWGLVNIAVRDWAKRYTYDLVRGITGTTQRFLQDALADWIASDAPLDDLLKQIEPMFGAVRAEMIGVTEVTRAFAVGNVEAWKASGLVAKQKWMTGRDELVCPTCGALDGNEFPLGDAEHTPPAHVRCRCYLQPVVKL